MLNTIVILRHKNNNNKDSDLYFCDRNIPHGLASYILENYHYRQYYLLQENTLLRVQTFHNYLPTYADYSVTPEHQRPQHEFKFQVQ
jgi:hypothetical protein